MGELTFAQVTEANTTRCGRWHGDGWPAQDTWSTADWSNAMMGEVGEVAEALEAFLNFVAAAGKAGNTTKKLRRVELGTVGQHDPTEEQLRANLAEEIADVFLYGDLFATRVGVDLQAAIVAKFNKVSEAQGFPDRLG